MNTAFAMNRPRFPSILRTATTAAAMAAALFAAPAATWAAEPALVLVQGSSIAITGADLRADALRIPPEMRAIVLAKPQNVAQIAENLYIRRAMAQQAETEGLVQDPVTAAALQVARDKVLSDALLAKIEQSAALGDAEAEGLARNIYKAKPERFKTLEQVQARHILIADPTPESRAQAEKLLQELKGGADFAKLAEQRSADPGSAAKGGDLGLFARGRMVPEFDEAAFALKKPGDLSGVVESKFGYHIVQLQARKPAGIKPFDEVRDELVKEVRGSLQQEARMSVVQKLQQGAKANAEAIEAFAASYGKDSKTAP